MRLAAATAAAPDDATRFTQEETLRTATAELSELVRAQKAAAAAALADATRFASNPVLAVTAAALADVTPALLAHAQSSHSATARRAYRKELITKQRLAGKTGKHTHYEYRRQAANERTRVAGRFQKKNQGEATMNERTPEEVRGERKAANKRALAPEEDRGERKEDAPLDGTADYLVRLHKAPRTSPLAVPAFPGLLPPDPGPAVPGLLFHYSKMSNGMSQPPASGALREPASSLGTSRTHAAPAPHEAVYAMSPWSSTSPCPSSHRRVARRLRFRRTHVPGPGVGTFGRRSTRAGIARVRGGKQIGKARAVSTQRSAACCSSGSLGPRRRSQARRRRATRVHAVRKAQAAVRVCTNIALRTKCSTPASLVRAPSDRARPSRRRAGKLLLRLRAVEHAPIALATAAQPSGRATRLSASSDRRRARGA